MKHHRVQQPCNSATVDEYSNFISSDQLLDYLRSIMSRFCGYQYISLSKPLGKIRQDGKLLNELQIVVHRSLPCQNEQGCYRSIKDQVVRYIYAEKPDDFDGLVMDRNKHYVFGNPFPTFKQEPTTQLPELGNPPSVAAEFNPQDETAEPI